MLLERGDEAARREALELAREPMQRALRHGLRDPQVWRLAAKLEAALGNPLRAAFYREQADLVDPLL